MNRIAKVLTAAGVSVGLAACGVIAAAPASAVTVPHVNVQKYQAYNYPDSYGQVQHYDKIGSKFMYGNWAPRGNWSNQSSCWTGVTSYYYNFKA